MAAKVATMRQSPEQTQRGRTLREAQTEAESLLWSLLRTKQLCHMKFRRQHPIGPFFADFACESQKLVVELDGDYHAHVQENDLRRQQYLAGKGWNVVRFTNEVVLRDVERCFACNCCPLGNSLLVSETNAQAIGDDEPKQPV